MKKNKSFIEWSYGEGETPVSVNIEHIASMGGLNKFKEAETSKSLFAGYSEAARGLRMEGLYNAVMDKHSSLNAKPAAPEAEKPKGTDKAKA